MSQRALLGFLAGLGSGVVIALPILLLVPAPLLDPWLAPALAGSLLGLALVLVWWLWDWRRGQL